MSDMWKSKPLIICKTPGMTLWMGLQLLKYHRDFTDVVKYRPRNIEPFPGKIEDCRCSYCRYYKIFRGY